MITHKYLFMIDPPCKQRMMGHSFYFKTSNDRRQKRSSV